jgi:hypothetical protein
MASDAVILAAAVQTVPAGYTVPLSAELLIVSVRGLMDGTGAGGTFTPTLQLISPGGATVWNSPVSASVAAGGSADCSWFPGVAGGQAAAATGLQGAWATLVGGPALTNGPVSWGTVGYHPALQTAFSWDVTKTNLTLLTRGVYMFFVFWDSTFAAGNYVQTQMFVSGQTYLTPGYNLQRNVTNTSDFILTGAVPQFYEVGAPGGAALTVNLQTNNPGGTAPIQCSVQAVYLGA